VDSTRRPCGEMGGSAARSRGAESECVSEIGWKLCRLRFAGDTGTLEPEDAAAIAVGMAAAEKERFSRAGPI